MTDCLSLPTKPGTSRVFPTLIIAVISFIASCDVTLARNAGSDFDPLSIPATQSNIDLQKNFCAVPPHEQLCDILPNDVSDFNSSLVYTLIERNAQDPFDVFSWQTFVALNGIDGDDEFLPWQYYETPTSLFGAVPHEACPDHSPGEFVVSDFIQSQGQPLIDQAGNYIVYDVRINPDMADYIRENQLQTVSGQRAFQNSGAVIDYPRGTYDNSIYRQGGRVGAMAIKSAWRVLENATVNQYLTRPARIAVSPEVAIDGRARCIAVTLGLVGFHIIRRTTAGNGGDWVWATFEHEDNAPYADNVRGPNSIFDAPLFPGGCTASMPARDNPDREYTFFNPACDDCPTNTSSASVLTARWYPSPPFAGIDAVPAQVTRCWRPASSTRRVNAVWQRQLGDSPLARYRLSTTQWKGAPESALFPDGEVPRFMTNTTMETYIQDHPSGSCLGCHADATDALGNAGNFSFILTRAKIRGTQTQ